MEARSFRHLYHHSFDLPNDELNYSRKVLAKQHVRINTLQEDRMALEMTCF